MDRMMHLRFFLKKKKDKLSILVNCLSSSIASVAGEINEAANASSIIRVHSSSRLNSCAIKNSILIQSYHYLRIKIIFCYSRKDK